MNEDSIQKYIFFIPYIIQSPLCVFLPNILRKKRLRFIENKCGINPSNLVYFTSSNVFLSLLFLQPLLLLKPVLLCLQARKKNLLSKRRSTLFQEILIKELHVRFTMVPSKPL